MSSTPSPVLRLVKTKRALAAHPPRVAVHDFEAGADQGCQIGLVDDEQVGAGDARAALARDLVAGGDVDDVDRQIGEFGRKGRGKVVAARFDQDQVELREQPVHLGDRGEVDRGVLADRGMRAAAGLDAADALGRQGAAPGQEFGVLAGVDVVGDRGDLETAAHRLCTANPSARSCPSRPVRRSRPAADRALRRCS